MKILHLSKLYPPFMGGIEMVVYDLVEETKKFASQVDVLCVSDTNKSNVESYANSVIYRCSSFAHLHSTYLSVTYLLRWLKIRNNYDVIHVHVPNPLAALCLFLLPSKAKVVVHWHSDIVKQKLLKRVLSPIHNSLLRKCESLVATSIEYANASAELQLHKNKLKIIPIGICDNRLIVCDDRVKEIINENPKNIILAVGRHVYYKGFEYLIDSAQYLSDDYIILLGGQGVLTSSLKNKVDKLNLSSKVKFLGRIADHDLANYYKAASVFCLPSIERSEAFGVVQLEAMALGTPIVSTEIPGSGVSWVNENEITGYVVPPRNSKALADAFICVCEGKKIKEYEVKKRFKNFFTREVMANEFKKIYDEKR